MVNLAIPTRSESSSAFTRRTYGFGLSFFGKRQIRRLEKYRVNLRTLDEGLNLHVLAGWRRDFLKLLVFYKYILPLLVFVPLDYFRPIDDAMARGAVQRLAQTRVTLLVNLVQVDPLGARCRIQPDGNTQKSKTDGPSPNRSRHLRSSCTHGWL